MNSQQPAPDLPESLLALTACMRPLLLQGPMGPFFGQLANYLEASGLSVRKVHFNGGDEHFYRRNDAIRYTSGPEAWEPWLRSLVVRERIDAVVLFGQARPMHRVAARVARELGLRLFVFEEGYIRPHYVTLEVGGVNGHTSLSRDAASYKEAPHARLETPQETAQRFRRMAWYAVRYAVSTAIARPSYPGNTHHRDLGVGEAARWLRSGWRKMAHAWRERHVLADLTRPENSKRWFLLPLQVYNDAQLTDHSPFVDMSDAIGAVMASFAKNAPAQTMLVVKHHPMDRAYRDYSGTIDKLAQRFGLAGRVRYVHDLHLPTLLKHARGVVTVNSTTGLQAMYHGTPVCVLGDCMYAVPGLVHLDGLSTFWRNPAPVQRQLFRRFRAEVIRLTQLNVSFYGDTPALRTVEPVIAKPASQNAFPSEQPFVAPALAHRADSAHRRPSASAKNVSRPRGRGRRRLAAAHRA